ncbi:hypothetical protein CBS101457_003834 [Exobasidium rhododendri]|nr:hypothetical protein CBS101457_003834 [Exobasidium rhododendri]
MSKGTGPATAATTTPLSNNSWTSSLDNLSVKSSNSSKESEGKVTSHHHHHHPLANPHKGQVGSAAPANTLHPHHTYNHASSNPPLLSPHSIVAQNDTVSVPSRGSSINLNSAINQWSHHPRQPHSTADSYFPNSAGGHNASSQLVLNNTSLPQKLPRTPGSSRGHSRQTSAASGPAGPNSAIFPSRERSSKSGTQNMSLSLSTGMGDSAAGGDHQQHQVDFANFAEHSHAGPPSPSTLTDIILGLHSTLYGMKKTPEEVRERVEAFYDQDAVFESPLLSAKGREQIADQFIMAFSLPGMDVTSELRDVICSDFEFDGTRAGIIDQTISVTFLPSLFGSQGHSSSSSQSYHASHPQHDRSGTHAGTSTPGYTLQSAGVTPHPFASQSQAQTPAGGAGSMFSRFSISRPHSPTTPYSLSGLWGSSRPHTPGGRASHMKPLSTPFSQRPSTPPSVNGDDEEEEQSQSELVKHAEDSTRFITADESGGGQVSRPKMPVDHIIPHWTSDGLGRGTVHAFLWGILHPRAVLKSLCTIHLRVMSRLEFNDAGHIVRHEDTWGVRETIEGTIPFASVVYALERRVVGYLCSFAIGRGFRLSSALTRSIAGPSSDQQHRQAWPLMTGDEKYDPNAAHDAARALLLGQSNRSEQLHSMARSRASSPSRFRLHSIHSASAAPAHGTGTRSRARSLVGSQNGQPLRAASTENLLSIVPSSAGYGDRERGYTTSGVESLPPDSIARYRDRGIRRTNPSTASAPVTASAALDSLWHQGDVFSPPENKSKAPDHDL